MNGSDKETTHSAHKSGSSYEFEISLKVVLSLLGGFS
ncbi:hypothetical protein FHT21_000333 [Pedobacter sp. SG908]|nr:hypothetical protein [Pedobacter sp. SG908]NMN35294.1 hypothetical protein [Pedobacter sp. SG918]